MAFRLTSRTSMKAGLQRIVDKEFRTALESLAARAPDEAAIHKARTSVKKIRSVLRLLKEDLPKFRAEQRRLRAAAQSLSSLRDADAASETLRALHGRYPAVLKDAIVRRVERGLRGRKQEARRKTRPLVQRGRSALRRARETVPQRVQSAATAAAVRDGLTRGYRRARRALGSLSKDSEASRFHEWRRRVKDHSYQVRLFEGLHSTPRARSQRLRDLQTWLGEDHNHALLRAAILAAPDRFGDASTTAVVLGCIAKHQSWLRGHALRLGHRLFSAKPADFRKSVGSWWPKGS